MATSPSGGASRGGYSWTLTTVNTMSNAKPQASLTQYLAAGVYRAHRQDVRGGVEHRNFRRSNYFGQAHRHRGGG
jgi:hypothetical protein